MGTVLSAPVLIVVYGWLLVRTSPRLVVAALAAILLHAGVTRFLRGPIRRLATDQFSAFADLAARFQEAIASIRVVKSFGAERFEMARVGRALVDVIRVNMRFGVYKHIEEPGRAMVNYVVEASILGLAAWELLAGRISAPAFFLFLYVGRAVMIQVGALGGAYTRLQTTLAASAVSRAVRARARGEGWAGDHRRFHDRIRVDDVSFDYGGERVLEHVSFEMRKGEFVALVGPSGAGKSTLADLLLRFYDPVAGRITIDGRDLRDLRQDAYRRLFGVVSQEALLMNATIRENIAYGRDGLDEADIVRAARIANAHDFILEFPDGYGTLVGDRGVRLSGGQRQRVAIARAIVGRPVHPDPGRGDQLARQRVRAPRAAGDRARHRGHDVARHRAPPLDGAPRRQDRRAGARRGRGGRPPRRPARVERDVRPAVPAPVHRGRIPWASLIATTSLAHRRARALRAGVRRVRRHRGARDGAASWCWPAPG